MYTNFQLNLPERQNTPTWTHIDPKLTKIAPKLAKERETSGIMDV
jgi:hypothetical protein